jgi:hypothetical protein
LGWPYQCSHLYIHLYFCYSTLIKENSFRLSACLIIVISFVSYKKYGFRFYMNELSGL